MPGARASQCEHVFTCSQHDGAGLDRVLCVVREMDDDEATLRNAADNVATPPPWYDLCLYVHRNAVADSKKGLSRTMLAEAATGKSGNAAAMEGHRLAAAGSVLAQSFHVERLLVEVNLTRHLATIAPLPPTCYPAMVDLLLERGWSVKDTQAAVERVQNDTRARMLRQPDSFWRERLKDLDELSDRLLRILAGLEVIASEPPDAWLPRLRGSSYPSHTTATKPG